MPIGDEKYISESVECEFPAEIASVMKDLLSTKGAIERQLAEAQNSAIGRATIAPVDVLFVPYTNAAKFAEGTPLYTCRFTMLIC